MVLVEAANAGFVETDNGRYQRIQILTIEGILDYREVPRLPAVDSGGFKKAPKERRAARRASSSEPICTQRFPPTRTWLFAAYIYDRK